MRGQALIFVKGNYYEVEKAGAVGDGATAGSVNFNEEKRDAR
jgi:hypothetical protein